MLAWTPRGGSSASFTLEQQKITEGNKQAVQFEGSGDVAECGRSTALKCFTAHASHATLRTPLAHACKHDTATKLNELVHLMLMHRRTWEWAMTISLCTLHAY